jgi:dienelactone hydrolase
VLQIDSRACARPSAPVTLGAKETHDAEAGLEFLLGRPEVEEIGVFGFSMGAAAAVRTAAQRTEIAAVVAEGGYYNLGDDLVEPTSQMSILRRAFVYYCRLLLASN